MKCKSKTSFKKAFSIFMGPDHYYTSSTHVFSWYGSNKRLTLFIAIFLVLLNYLPGQSQTKNCDLKIDKDGIKVYTCRSDTSKFRSLITEFTLENITFEELQAFLWKVDNYVNWQYNMVDAILLKKVNEQSIIYRSEVDAPWPVQNREMIVQLSVNNNLGPDQLSFSMHTVSTDYPLSEDLTRVPYSQATWTVKRVKNKLFVTYQLNIDPGGYIPPMLVNLAMAEGPYESFHNLKNLLEKKNNR